MCVASNQILVCASLTLLGFPFSSGTNVFSVVNGNIVNRSIYKLFWLVISTRNKCSGGLLVKLKTMRGITCNSIATCLKRCRPLQLMYSHAWGRTLSQTDCHDEKVGLTWAEPVPVFCSSYPYSSHISFRLIHWIFIESPIMQSKRHSQCHSLLWVRERGKGKEGERARGRERKLSKSLSDIMKESGRWRFRWVMNVDKQRLDRMTRPSHSVQHKRAI